MANAREELDLIVDKFAQQIVIANGEVLNATNLTIAVDYLERTPQVRKVDEHLQALEIIVKKDIDVDWVKVVDTLEEYNASVGLATNLLTQEEYDLVLKVVKEIEDER